MTDTILHRMLWYFDGEKRRRAGQEILQTSRQSLVILGEPGIGKSTLLRQLGHSPAFKVCTARTLINMPDGAPRLAGAETMVIDALDEVPAQRDGDAVDLVVRKLGALGYPRFILSCRVADWRSATALQGLADVYGEAPLELYLEPLEKPDALEILGAATGTDTAEAAIDELQHQGLEGFWSNPQTLSLLAEVLSAGSLPRSRGELFRQATALLRNERRETKSAAPLAALPEKAVLDAAGAAFATLILTGSEAISLRSAPAPDDLPIREIVSLPGASAIRDVLDSRLFVALESERFTYSHRAIGEFLGARWLAQCASTSRKRRRIHGLFNPNALVPTSLRGMHAWLAWHSPDLADAVLRADPNGVVQYGDANTLTASQARTLLDSFEGLSRENPWFHDWTRYQISGIAQPSLLTRLREVIASSGAEFGLRLLVLEALEGSPLAASLADELETLVRDSSAAFALRSLAAHRLHEGSDRDWSELVMALRHQNNEDGLRLAIEIIDLVGYDRFADEVIVEIVLAQLAIEERTVGVLHRLERQLPVERIDALLNALVRVASAQGEDDLRELTARISDLSYALMARRLVKAPVDPRRLWTWLEPLNDHGIHAEGRNAVAAHLKADQHLRRSVQRIALLDRPSEGNVWHAMWRMTERSAGLAPDEADVIALLDGLDSKDAAWRDIVQMVRHHGTEGEVVRARAARFAAGDIEARAWLESLRNPIVPDWKLEQEERRQKREAEKQARWEQHRAQFGGQIDKVRAGEFGLVVNLAKAYLKLFDDIGDGEEEGPARLEKWLGPELRDAALAGFEAFLKREPAHPDAAEIADSYARSRRWDAVYIVVAALAERHRSGWGYSDLSDERIMAGFFEVRHSRIDQHAGIPQLGQTLSAELRRRDVWEKAERIYLEPQFTHGLVHVDGLYGLMNEAADKAMATRLGLEWLRRFPRMPIAPESEILGHLLGDGAALSDLRSAMTERRADAKLDEQRRRNWDALGLLIDFDTTSAELEKGELDRELFWSVRARLGRRHESMPFDLSAEQLAWLLRRFRASYPLASRPSGVTSGDSNAWDASDFMAALIRRLGEQTSNTAIIALAELRDETEDGYTELLRVVAAEQKRKRFESEWGAPSLAVVASTVEDEAPNTAAQLQAVVLEELRQVQHLLRGSDVDWYRDFMRDGAPRGEEDCRDALLKMLRPLPFGIQAFPEGHLADDKRCDILCILGSLMTPIEVKGQWHSELWTAADRQLDRLYVNDARAEAGIYLVLWFGVASAKRLKSPPDGIELPTSASTLEKLLTKRSATTQEGRVTVVVLDLERPA